MFFFIQNLLSVVVWIGVAYLFGFSFWGWIIGLFISYIAHEFIIPIFLVSTGQKVVDYAEKKAEEEDRRHQMFMEYQKENWEQARQNVLNEDAKVHINISEKNTDTEKVNEEEYRIKLIEQEIKKLSKPNNQVEFYTIFLTYKNEKLESDGIKSVEKKNRIVMGDEGNRIFEDLTKVFRKQHLIEPDNLLIAFKQILNMDNDLADSRFKDVFNMTGIKNEIMKIVRIAFRDTQEFKIYARMNRIIPN